MELSVVLHGQGEVLGQIFVHDNLQTFQLFGSFTCLQFSVFISLV